MIVGFISFVGPELIIMMVLTAFWIWMIIDCATKETEQRAKMTWLLVILLIPLGCVVYFFARKISRSN